MFERQPPPVTDLDAANTLSRIEAGRAMALQVDVDLLECSAHWADLHGVVDTVTGAGGRALPGTERLVALGGVGTPEVAEFAPAELGAVLAMSPYAAGLLIADALDLRHRLPSIWDDCRSGVMQPWMARKVAQATRHLSVDAAGVVDVSVSRWAGRFTWTRLAKIVDGLVIAADPALAEQLARAARDQHGVWVSPSSDDGSKTVFIRTQASDAIWFDATIDRLADSLQALGDDTSKDIRRARAVGIIANPQQALDLFTTTAAQAADHAATAGDDSGVGEVSDAGGPAAEPDTSDAPDAANTVTRPRGRVDSRPLVTLYVHLSEKALTRGAGVARVEGIGPVTVGQVKDWLGHCSVTMRPVIDIAGMQPVDAYEIPDRIREAVHLRSPADVFPYASSVNRKMDLDHTIPYRSPDEGGPPGQTSVENLAPLTRFHHRIRTHGKWTVRSPLPGTWLWRSPTGRHYLVDHTGTRPVPRPQPESPDGAIGVPAPVPEHTGVPTPA